MIGAHFGYFYSISIDLMDAENDHRSSHKVPKSSDAFLGREQTSDFIFHKKV